MRAAIERGPPQGFRGELDKRDRFAQVFKNKAMPSKPRKPSKLNKNKRVKAIARERVGAPKPAFAIPEKAKRAKPKHKKLVTVDDEGR